MTIAIYLLSGLVGADIPGVVVLAAIACDCILGCVLGATYLVVTHGGCGG